MSTAFFKVVGAVIALLQADRPVCSDIYRARPNVLDGSVDSAVNVQWERATAQPGAIHLAPIDWSTRLSVECYARSLKDSGDVAVDPLLEAVYARLAVDTTLGGLVADLNIVGIEAENSAEGKKTGWVRLIYDVQHRTENSTLE